MTTPLISLFHVTKHMMSQNLCIVFVQFLQKRADMVDKIFDALIEWGKKPASDNPELWTGDFSDVFDKLIVLLKYATTG